MALDLFRLYGEVSVKGLDDAVRGLGSLDDKAEKSAKSLTKTENASGKLGRSLSALKADSLGAINREVGTLAGRIPLIGQPLANLTRDLLGIGRSDALDSITKQSQRAADALKIVESQAAKVMQRVQNRSSDFGEGLKINFGSKIDTDFLKQFRGTDDIAKKIELLASKGFSSDFVSKVERAGHSFEKLERDGAAAMAAVESKTAAATATLAGFESQAAAAAGGVSLLGGAATVAVVGVAALAAVAVAADVIAVKSAMNFAEYAGRIHDLSQESGLAAETVSTLGAYSKLAGTDIRQVVTGFEAYGRNAAEAAHGNKALAAQFQRFGIDAKKALKDPDQAARDLFDHLAKIQNPFDRLDAAQKLASKSGKVLATVAKEMDGSFENAMRTAKEWGVVLSEQDIRAADKFSDAMDIMGMKVQGILYDIGKGALPQVQKALDDISGRTNNQHQFWQNFGRDAGEALGGTLKLLDKVNTGLEKYMTYKRVINAIEESNTPAEAWRSARNAYNPPDSSRDFYGPGGAARGGGFINSPRDVATPPQPPAPSTTGNVGGRRAGGVSVLQQLTGAYERLSSQVRTFGQDTARANAEELILQATHFKGIDALRGRSAVMARDVLSMADELDRQNTLKKAEDERTRTREKFNSVLEQQADRLRELAGGETAAAEIGRLLSDPTAAAALDEKTQSLLRTNAALIDTRENAKKAHDAFLQMSGGLDKSIADAQLRSQTLGVEDPSKRLAIELAAVEIPKDVSTADYNEIIAKRLRLVEVTRQLTEQERIYAADKSFENALEQMDRSMLDVREATAAQRLEYELTVGTLKDLNEAQRELLRGKSLELEAARSEKEALDRQKELLEQRREAMMRFADDLSGIARHGAQEGWKGIRDDFRDMLLDMAQDYLRSQFYKLLTGDKTARQSETFSPLGAAINGLFHRGSSGSRNDTAGAIGNAGAEAVTAITGAGSASAKAVEVTGDSTAKGLGHISTTLLSGLGSIAAQIAVGQKAPGFWAGLGMAALNGFISGLAGGIGGSIHIGGGGSQGGIGAAAGAAIGGFASGGRIAGPGTETSDSIAAWLSKNEYVISAKAARRIGYSALDYMNQTGELPSRSLRLADGGRVTLAAPVTVAPGVHYIPPPVRASEGARRGGGGVHVEAHFDLRGAKNANEIKRVLSDAQIDVMIAERVRNAQRFS